MLDTVKRGNRGPVTSMRFVSVDNDNVVNIMFVSMSSKYPTCLSSTYMMCFATVPRTIQIDSKLRDACDDLAAYIASIHDRVVIIFLLTNCVNV